MTLFDRLLINFFRAVLKIVLEDASLISGESNLFHALRNDMSGCLEVEYSRKKGTNN